MFFFLTHFHYKYMYHTSYKQFSLIDKVYMKEISLLTHEIFKNKTMYISFSMCQPKFHISKKKYSSFMSAYIPDGFNS